MNQPWIHKPETDLLFILSPPFVILLLIMLFSEQLSIIEEKYSFWTWLFLIVCIDVAHVYASLFKTYFNKEQLNKNKRLFLTLPSVALCLSIALCLLGTKIFWSFLAYVAVFHFVRQQYGFMRLYSRGEQKTTFGQYWDKINIYNATIFPMLYWFLTPDRKFNWFLDNEFLQYNAPKAVHIFHILYGIIVSLHILIIGYQWLRTKYFNIPKQLIIIGTYLSWYCGIVYYNNELIFTAFNVISHGIPYMALIFFKEIDTNKNHYIWVHKALKNNGWLTFIVFLLVIAFLEEYFWELFIWNEHFSLENITVSEEWHFIWIPLLALPQLTHYLLDGFIWKSPKKIRS